MDIILLTNGYPYPNKDVFVGNEIDIISKKFENVYIIPVIDGVLENKLIPSSYQDSINIELPANVKVVHLNFSDENINKLDREVKILIENELNKYENYSEQDYITIKNEILKQGLSANFIKNNVEQFIFENNINKKNTILYSFWWHESALAISLLRSKYALAVSRAHRYDLYKHARVQLFKEYMLDKLECVYACSQQGAQYIKKHYNNANNVDFSYLGVSKLSSNKTQKSNNRNNILKIVTCSNIIPVKRLDRLIDVLNKVENLCINWTHIGYGTDFEKIKNYAEEKLTKTKKNITYNFLGKLKNEDIKKYYEDNEVDLFINVSSSEGLPVSIMEAISYGIPVIATDVGGVSEIIKNKQNGFIISKDFNDAELLNLLNLFSTMDNNKYDNYSKNCIKIWGNKFDSYRTYSDFFDNLINRCKYKLENNLKYNIDSRVGGIASFDLKTISKVKCVNKKLINYCKDKRILNIEIDEKTKNIVLSESLQYRGKNYTTSLKNNDDFSIKDFFNKNGQFLENKNCILNNIKKEELFDIVILSYIIDSVPNCFEFVEKLISKIRFKEIIVIVSNTYSREVLYKMLKGKQIINSNKYYTFTPMTLIRFMEAFDIKTVEILEDDSEIGNLAYIGRII